ncbi:endonuclease domain-containing 1 protein-like isoform X1 [Acipenser ruthenus]|uniref:endonuclease domain-containing 1 protein-like isoform X1 n=1 Tax=Acipenser ruthenus TaxID=7906 RepID=UPI002741A74D|nr:endonuclease domain-containing 1 protein-like isoform X1 [Acipenser ruthenus]
MALALVTILVVTAAVLRAGDTEIVRDFNDIPQCLEFFYERTPPALGPVPQRTAKICQKFNNGYHFATLYDKAQRIPLYSAYVFQKSNGGGREKRWFIEPQLVNNNWQGGMQDAYRLSKEHPNVYLGVDQALDEDYKSTGFDRGHLNPNGHHAGDSRNATFSLTNIVPQNRISNQGAWRLYEEELARMFSTDCATTFVVVGTVPSQNSKLKDRVNIPDWVWSAYCCVNNNGMPLKSVAATSLNTDQNKVNRLTLRGLHMFLQDQMYTESVQIFTDECM